MIQPLPKDNDFGARTHPSAVRDVAESLRDSALAWGPIHLMREWAIRKSEAKKWMAKK
jgi:hypothetical protein